MLTIESPWLSGRAPEHRIGRSEVQFLIETQNFFLCLMLMTRPKKSFCRFFITANWVLISLSGILMTNLSKKFLLLMVACIYL